MHHVSANAKHVVEVSVSFAKAGNHYSTLLSSGLLRYPAEIFARISLVNSSRPRPALMRPTGSRLHLRAAMDAHLASKRRLHSAQIAFRARVIVARFARVPRRSCQARSSPAQPCPVQPCPARPSPARPCPALSSSTLSSSALSSPVGALLFGRWTGSRRPPGSINALLKKIPFWAPIYSPCKPHFIHKIFPRTLSGNYRHPRLAQGKAAVLSSCTQIGEENRGAPHIFRFGFGTSIAHWIRSNLCVASRP